MLLCLQRSTSFIATCKRKVKRQKSTKVSREHTVSEVTPGLISNAGGKLTTYRVMAEDELLISLLEIKLKQILLLTAST